METHTLGAGQLFEFILTRGRNYNEDGVNCGNTNLKKDMIVAVVIAI